MFTDLATDPMFFLVDPVHTTLQSTTSPQWICSLLLLSSLNSRVNGKADGALAVTRLVRKQSMSLLCGASTSTYVKHSEAVFVVPTARNQNYECYAAATRVKLTIVFRFRIVCWLLCFVCFLRITGTILDVGGQQCKDIL